MITIHRDKEKRTDTWGKGFTLLLSLFTFISCDVKDPIYDTMHPGHGKITLTTNWSATNTGVPPAAGYTVRVGDYSATLTGVSNTINNLFTPGNYTLYAHNTADHISVSGSTATVAASGGGLNPLPGWLYSGIQEVAVSKDTDHTFTLAMAQQVRGLTLMIEPSGGTMDRITSITCTLSGVAGTLDLATGTHGAASSVGLDFAKISSGENAGKWSASVRLLGITGTVQELTCTITFADGSPADFTFVSDLATALANFNTDKRTPLTLASQIVETPTETGFTATISKWGEVKGSGTAH